jgi:hypothetical protein
MRASSRWTRSGASWTGMSWWRTGGFTAWGAGSRARGAGATYWTAQGWSSSPAWCRPTSISARRCSAASPTISRSRTGWPAASGRSRPRTPKVRLLVRDARRGGAAAGRHDGDPRHGDGATHRRRVPRAGAHRHPRHGGEVPHGRAVVTRGAARADRPRPGGGDGPVRALARPGRRAAALVLRAAVRPLVHGADAPGRQRPRREDRHDGAHPCRGNTRRAGPGEARDRTGRADVSRFRRHLGRARGAGALRG